LAYRLFDFSSDVGIEADGATVSEALVDLAGALAHVLTDGSALDATEERSVDVQGARDWPGTAVAWINELIFLFDTEQFLVVDGDLHVTTQATGVKRIQGKVRGERFNQKQHRAGRGVKAATFHGAEHTITDGVHRFRLVLDL
jgi:SHS2 domain-containing protein